MSHAMRSRKRGCTQHADMRSTKRVRQEARKSFLDLPRELRDIIYELCLVSTKAIDVCQLATPSCNPKKLGISTACLRVSRQIHHEALEVMYGLNTFEAKISLDPRIPHSYDHDPKSCAQRRGCTFDSPMVNNVKRLIIRLEFAALSSLPVQDPSFPAEVLQAFVLDGSPDIILLQPDSFSSYVESLQHSNALLGAANAALAAARGSLFSTYLLACVNARDKGMHVVCTPQPRASFGFLDFPWVRMDPQPSVTAACEVSCYVPSRFKSTGQMGLVG